MAPSAILDFEIRYSDTAALLGVWRWSNLWSLTVLRSAVEKLLRFLFSIGNALEVPKIGVFGDFGGQNWNLYLCEPQKAPPCAKTRVLTYYSPKSVNNCDLSDFSRKKTKKKRTPKTSMLGGAGEVVCKPIPMKFGSLVEEHDVMKWAKFHRPRSLPFGNIVVQSWRL